MAREKRSCDHERPICRRLATKRIIARKVRVPKTRHVSQYCDDCAELIRSEVPQGWEIVSVEPIGVPA